MAKMRFAEFPHNHGIGAIDRVLTEVVDELQAQAEHLATPLRKTSPATLCRHAPKSCRWWSSSGR